MSFLLDWTNIFIAGGDGSTTLTSGGDSVGVTVTGQGETRSGYGVDTYYRPETTVTTQDTTTFEFDAPVQNVSFELFDIDQSSTGSWDDLVTIVAYAPDGTLLPVTFSDLTHHTVNGNTIEGNGDEGVKGGGGTGSEDAVTVNIPGPVASFELILAPGSSSTQTGQIGFSDITFELTTSSTPPCFTTGMKIKTERGDIAVEDLVAGDLIWTLDNGFQPLRYLFRSTCAAVGSLRPIVFEAGSIGNDEPLIVSQRHRMFVKTLPYEVRKIFQQYQDNLVQALALVNGRTIRVAKEYEEITYFHMMMDDHQLVHCHGTYSESWQPTKSALKASPEVAAELLEIFPDMEDRRSFMKGALVRHELKIEEDFLQRMAQT